MVVKGERRERQQLLVNHGEPNKSAGSSSDLQRRSIPQMEEFTDRYHCRQSWNGYVSRRAVSGCGNSLARELAIRDRLR